MNHKNLVYRMLRNENNYNKIFMGEKFELKIKS